MRSALVFGGSGQIGVPVIERLLANDWHVTAVSRAPQVDSAELEWLRGDLQQVEGLPQQVDAIFSLGPLDHFSRWYSNTTLIAARVIAFGSTSLETKQESEDLPERDVAVRLGDAEARIFEVARQRQAGATVLRPTLVYGAGRDKTLTRIASLARRTGFFVLPGNANGLRQPVHVQDLADAALAAVESANAHGRSYALPGGETLAYAEMVKRTLASLQPPARLVRVPTPLFKAALAGAHALGKMQSLGGAAVARMQQDLVFDLGPAQRDFGYAPRAFQPTDGMFSL
ncbi:NAD-dependent epimerase/dehydratase family protein [Pseudoxanthomonas sp. CF125]|uniref:NAD-dependent epimerase/dehydratase family protein n=1 Tax=Pseudoxanthomonas sp. CF125 TaxID=1855303 RepID=UPI0008844239|nr:NAD-dependent epimerase/dehydratase family protein [Pseudoxanthomonas sp. CF125]SDQ87743.1 Nucleoside-diphosphate-sugar epimerase [Pseudoxanthomonas sp. CF125]